MLAQTQSVQDLDELDLTACVVGPYTVLDRRDGIVLYTRHGRNVRELGRFDSAAQAMNALDVLDGIA